MTFGDDHCWVILSFSKKEPVGKGCVYIWTTLDWGGVLRKIKDLGFDLLTVGLKKPKKIGRFFTKREDSLKNFNNPKPKVFNSPKPEIL
jgi:hypothetical protein